MAKVESKTSKPYCFGSCHIGGYPLNFVGLCCLTGVMALQVGVICGAFTASGLGPLVMQAALITGLLVLGLTIYTFRSLAGSCFTSGRLILGRFGWSSKAPRGISRSSAPCSSHWSSASSSSGS